MLYRPFLTVNYWHVLKKRCLQLTIFTIEMRKLFILLLCLKSLFAVGQQTGTFYFSIHGEPCDTNAAKTKYNISSSSPKLYTEKTSTRIDSVWEPATNYYRTYLFENDSDIIITTYNNSKITGTIKRVYKKLNDTRFSFSDSENDSIILTKGTTLSLLPMKYDGEIDDFYKNGNKRSEAIYKNNRLISNLRWKENGEKDISNVFNQEEAEIEPQLSESTLNEIIKKELKYPDEAITQHIKGRVVIQMVVMEDGSVEGLRIINAVHPLLDNEAIRVVRSTDKKWIPGKIDNTPVRVAVNFPINFIL